MASSSLTVWCDKGLIRVYGGTRSSVRSMLVYYQKMSEAEFLEKHKYLSSEDFKTLKLSTRFNKS